jgi:hypothetical protein
MSRIILGLRTFVALALPYFRSETIVVSTGRSAALSSVHRREIEMRATRGCSNVVLPAVPA